MKSALMAGAGKAAIEIPESFFPYRSFKGRTFTGQHDALYVRSLVIANEEEKTLLVSLELGEFGDVKTWLPKFAALSGIPEDHIFVSATHNHLSPFFSSDQWEDIKDIEKTEDFVGWTWDAVERSVSAALQNCRSASVSFGKGSCDVSINRDDIQRPHTVIGNNPHGYSDKTVYVLKFSDGTGAPIAVLYSYAVHSSVMMGLELKDGGMLLSGDLAGFTSRYVEEAYGGDTVAFFALGAAGNQDPKYTAGLLETGYISPMKREKMPPPGPDDGPPRLPKLRQVGDGGYLVTDLLAMTLADEVLLVADKLDNDKTQVEILSAHRWHTVPGQAKSGPDAPPQAQDSAEKRSRLYWYPDGEDIGLVLGYLQLNDIIFVCVPGELAAGAGQIIREAFAEKSDKVVVWTICNGYNGYMSDPVGYAVNAQEADRSHVARGWAERLFASGALELYDELNGKDKTAPGATEP